VAQITAQVVIEIDWILDGFAKMLKRRMEENRLAGNGAFIHGPEVDEIRELCIKTIEEQGEELWQATLS